MGFVLSKEHWFGVSGAYVVQISFRLGCEGNINTNAYYESYIIIEMLIPKEKGSPHPAKYDEATCVLIRARIG